jgi:hypothetical protein
MSKKCPCCGNKLKVAIIYSRGFYCSNCIKYIPRIYFSKNLIEKKKIINFLKELELFTEQKITHFNVDKLKHGSSGYKLSKLDELIKNKKKELKNE